MFLCSIFLSLFPSSFSLSIPHLSDQTVICADTPPLTQHGLNTKLALLLSMDFSGFLSPSQIFFSLVTGIYGVIMFYPTTWIYPSNVTFNWQAISAFSNYASFALFSLDFWVVPAVQLNCWYFCIKSTVHVFIEWLFSEAGCRVELTVWDVKSRLR